MKIDPSLLYRDELTNIFNRRFLRDRVPSILQEFHKRRRPYSVLFLDIDKFKEINDTWGHKAGDQALIEFTNILKKSIRKKDILIRYAGDEFIIILPGTSRTRAEEVARRILKNLSSPKNWITRKFMRKSSIGVAVFPEDAETLTQLIEVADARMYCAKRHGSGIVCYSDIVPGSEVFNLEVNIVGREAVVKELLELLDISKKGKFVNVLLEGPHGSGKRELMEILLSHVPDSITVTLSNSSNPAHENYFVFKNLLERLVRFQTEKFSSLLDSVSRLKRQKVMNFLESMSLKRRDEYVVVEFAAKLITQLSIESHIFVLFPNIEYSDARSLSLLNSVFQKLPADIPIFFILSYDPANVTFKPDVKTVVDSLKDLPATRIYKISPLSIRETSRLVTLLLGGPVPEEIIEKIHDVSEGLPSNIRALLDFLIRKNYISYGDLRWKFKEGFDKEIDNWYRERIKEYLHLLTTRAFEVLKVLNILGDLDVNFLSQLVDDENLFDTLSELTFYGLVKIEGRRVKLKDTGLSEILKRESMREPRRGGDLYRKLASKISSLGNREQNYLLLGAKLYFEAGDYENATKLLDKLIYESEISEKALKEVVELVNSPSISNKLLFWKQDFLKYLFHLGKYDLARELAHVTRTSITSPGIHWVNYLVFEIKAHLKQGDFDKVIEKVNENRWFIKKNGDMRVFIESLVLKARAYEKLGDPERALSTYATAAFISRNLRLDREEFFTRLAFLNVLFETNPDIDAYKSFVKKLLPQYNSLRDKSKLPEWMLNELVRAYSNFDFLDEILSLTDQICKDELADFNLRANCLYHRALVYLKSGSFPLMLNDIRASREMLQKFYPAQMLYRHHILEAINHYLTGNKEELRKLLQETDKFVETHFMFGFIRILYHMMSGRLNQAYSLFKEILSLKSNEGFLYRIANFVLFLFANLGYRGISADVIEIINEHSNQLSPFEKAMLYFNKFVHQIVKGEQKGSGDLLSASLLWARKGLKTIDNREVKTKIVLKSPYVVPLFESLGVKGIPEA